jgi:hypothetical protein
VGEDDETAGSFRDRKRALEALRADQDLACAHIIPTRVNLPVGPAHVCRPSKD